MPDPLVVYGFETSNNFKVRVALGFKRLSGQPMTPVLRHGDTVIFDSAAILRYLEANFLDSPRLFSEDYETMRDIERWESFSRGEMAEPLLIMVRQRLAGRDDPAEAERAAELFAKAVLRLERRLASHPWLVGGHMTAADVSAGAVVYRVQASGLLPLPDGITGTLGWADRVIAHDRYVDRR